MSVHIDNIFFIRMMIPFISYWNFMLLLLEVALKLIGIGRVNSSTKNLLFSNLLLVVTFTEATITLKANTLALIKELPDLC